MMVDSAARAHGIVRAIAAFVAGYVAVDLLPVVLPGTPVLKGLRVRDLADLALIFVLVALYVQLGLRARLWRSAPLRAAYAAALALMVQGHSIHLAGDAIAGASGPGAPAWLLIDFLDEHWGHTELHLSFIILAALFIGWARSVGFSSWASAAPRVERFALAFVSLAYGVLLAGDAIEGQTVLLMFPCAIALCLWGAWPFLRRGSAKAGPGPSLFRAFFAASFGVTAASILIYGLVNGGFPELSALALAVR